MEQNPDHRRLNQAVLTSAREGDMIEFPRHLYSHWGIYVGGNKVIHLAGEPGDNLSSKDVTVRRDDFWTVTGASVAKINNIWDKDDRALPPSEIVERATNKLGHSGYSLLFTNCEHFASWCRYSKARSSQTEAFNETMDKVGSTLKDILLDAAENHPDEQKRSSARNWLQLGQIIVDAKNKFIKDNKDDQLDGLKPGK